MAVQINEVIIKVVVDPTPSRGETTGPECPPDGSDPQTSMAEKILEILREMNER
jgi:hypothetical protein